MRDSWLLAGIIVGCGIVAYIVGGTESQAQRHPLIPEIPKPVAIQLSEENDGWIKLNQPGMREIYFRRASVVRMTWHDPSGPLFDGEKWVHIDVSVGTHDYRLDMLNVAEAKKFVAFVVGEK